LICFLLSPFITFIAFSVYLLLSLCMLKFTRLSDPFNCVHNKVSSIKTSLKCIKLFGITIMIFNYCSSWTFSNLSYQRNMK
jgi:hypothetical protein